MNPVHKSNDRNLEFLHVDDFGDMLIVAVYKSTHNMVNFSSSTVGISTFIYVAKTVDM